MGALGLLIPNVVLLIECVAALFWRSAEAVESELDEHPNLAVLMPAHDEAVCIRATLETITPQLQASDRLVVVADNCSDETAAIARMAGATVIERQDAERRGKGFALDYGLQCLEADPPDGVILVDADCRVQASALQSIFQKAIATGRPVQAVYLMEQPENPSVKDAISAFAFKVKNLVRPLGLTQLDFPCPLTGSGMAFPWAAIRSADLASGHIVEDMKLGLDLAIAGYPPTLCATALVVGCLPQQEQAANSQRTRWEHGHLQTISAYLPVLLKASIQQKRFDLLIMALDLAIPPLSLLVSIWLGLTIVACLAGILGTSWLPSILLAVSGSMLFTAIFGVWLKFGRAELSLRRLLEIPLYILWKIPLYLRFLIQPQKRWVRTERDTVDTTEP